MSDIKLTTKQTRVIGELATADAEHATHNESATDIYGQVMGKPVGQDFDRMLAIYDAYVSLWEHARAIRDYTPDYSMDYSALDRGWATQGAADWCAAHGHAYRIVDGVQVNQCPRCLAQVTVEAPAGLLTAETAPEAETTEGLAESNSLDAAPVLRVRIHPAHDLFMRGIKFATVKRATTKRVHLTTDAGQPVSVHPEYILPLDENWGTLDWVISIPGHGAVDETFAPSYLDALAFARSLHGATAVIRLTGWESN